MRQGSRLDGTPVRGTRPGGYRVPFWGAVQGASAGFIGLFYDGGRVPRNSHSQSRGASFRCRWQRNGPCRMRVMDSHGHAPSMFAGVGHYAPEHHSAMEGALADSASSASTSTVLQLRTTYALTMPIITDAAKSQVRSGIISRDTKSRRQAGAMRPVRRAGWVWAASCSPAAKSCVGCV